MKKDNLTGMYPYAIYGGKTHSFKINENDTKAYSCDWVYRAMEAHKRSSKGRGYEMPWNDVCEQSKRYYLEQVK